MMGLFDTDINIKDMPLRLTRNSFTKDRHIDYFVGIDCLEKDELKSLLKAISFNPNSPGAIYPRTELRPDTVVIISETIKYYDGPNHLKKLGEYMLANPSYDGRETIELYINSIRSSAQASNMNAGFLLVAVFVHELYHSLFHKNKPIREIEEPLAELGSILFMNAWLRDDDAFDLYFESIRNKKNYPEISFYGLGADLFCSVSGNQYSLREDSPQLIYAYRNKSLTLEDNFIREYTKRFPLSFACEDADDNQTRDLLLKILDC